MDFINELNENQREAVVNTEGPTLVIAGAGSGKTRVLTYRIANLLSKGVPAYRILALTFTNKAAREMQKRIATLVGQGNAANLWMGTFHSIFSKILRVEAEHLGYTSNFTIYDSQDSKNLIKSIVKDLKLDDKVYKPNDVLGRISMAKNNLVVAQAYAQSAKITSADQAAKKPMISEIYKYYQARCKQSDVMDFDDLLLQTNILFRDFPEILEKYQKKFDYILVDEYQDTNYSQYLIIKRLAEQHKNICVVGDDAQSIYSFRGARIENILNFRNDYPGYKLCKLEQNYRSTTTIVDAANSIISRNKEQIPKKTFSQNEEGDKIRVMKALSDKEEGFQVAQEIFRISQNEQAEFNNFAILYRTNAQSRIMEEALRKRNIPYKIYGGLSFYQRKEIKDLIAYLRLTINQNDEEALKRIINYPRRGIGDTTIDKLKEVAQKYNVSIWTLLCNLNKVPGMVSVMTAAKLTHFRQLIEGFTEIAKEENAYETTYRVAKASGIIEDLSSDDTPEGVKQIDTLAAEYPAQTNYLYLTYSGVANDVHYLGDHKSIVVLGSGAYRIGSSVEFDWCGVQALNTIRKEGYRSVMINYNPETVSTDYDMCDRLYFDELTFERVMDILDLENPHGVIVSTGGQIPNNLALRLDAQKVNILGTSAKSIDNAEDRDKFSAMLDRIGVDQPEWSALTSMEDINAFIEKVGFPVLVRPSYVLSGAAMNVCSNQEELERFLQLAANVSKKHPVVVSQFIEHAKEVEMDAVAQNGEIVAYAISEHIEFAGVHSGDATIQFPPQKLYVETVRRIKRISRQIAKELNISGPFNIQFLARENDIKVIECNLRASRSFPFVSKVLKINFIELATKVMLGLPVEKPEKNLFDLDYVGIKASQFSFNRLQKADPVLGVDMASTGEVGCIGDDTSCAVLKAMLSVGYRIPEKNVLMSTGTLKQKVDLLQAARALKAKGYNIFATGGSSKFLAENGVENTRVYWPSEEGQPQALEMLHKKEIDMVVNIPRDLTPTELENGYKIRRAAVDLNIPLVTNARLASAFINAFCSMSIDDIAIKSWDEYK